MWDWWLINVAVLGVVICLAVVTMTVRLYVSSVWPTKVDLVLVIVIAALVSTLVYLTTSNTGTTEKSVSLVTAKVSVLLIPFDQTQPMHLTHVRKGVLQEFQNLVHGDVQPLSLDEPAAELYVNEDGAGKDMPFNVRATNVLWGHSREHKGHTLILGPAFITGPIVEGYEVGVPMTLVDELLPRENFRVDVLAAGETHWATNSLEYATRETAYLGAVNLWQRWSSAVKLRVVPVSTPDRQEYVPGTEAIGW